MTPMLRTPLNVYKQTVHERWKTTQDDIKAVLEYEKIPVMENRWKKGQKCLKRKKSKKKEQENNNIRRLGKWDVICIEQKQEHELGMHD